MAHFEIKESTPRIANNKHWQFCVGSGQAVLALRTDYAAQLAFAHKELGFESVRFHGIFDECMEAVQGADSYLNIGRAKHFTNYNFLNIGVAYDNVLAAGMKPFVELSFMPGRLGKKRKAKSEISGINNSQPKDAAAWQDFIKAFIRFLIHRYGREEVTSWQFEVWNEPNIFVFFKGNKEDYFRLYELTVRAIKEVEPTIQVGGPSTALCAWLPEFIEFTQKNSVPLDFVTTHYYPGEPLGPGLMFKYVKSMLADSVAKMGKLRNGRVLDAGRCFMNDQTEDPKEMEKGLMGRHTAIARKEVGELPLYITEWNLSATITSYSNDTRKVAAFLVKSIAEMDGAVTGSSVWTFSDLFDEFVLLPDEFSGGFGLLTVSGIPKPQFHALKMMQRTGERKYDLPTTNEEIEIIVYESDEEKQLFVLRHRMKQVDEPPLDYEVAFELPWAPASVSLEKIDEDHCNPLKLWEEMGRPELNKEQTADIVARSALVPEAVEVRYADGVLKFDGALGVNDVHFYRIRRAGS
jgi:xylan 1,4-beta-xylosidase